MYAEIAKSDLRILLARIRGAAVFLCAATLSIAILQPALAGGPESYPIAYPWYGYGGPYFGPYSYHAATAAESYGRGLAEILRAGGEFNRLTSEAAINAQAARAQSITNAQDSVQAYFNIRRQARDYRQAERSPRPSIEAIGRYARDARPSALSPSELDSLTGRINWPILLQHEMFQASRAGLEELFDRWAVSRNLGAADRFGAQEYLAILQLTGEMIEQLRGQIQLLPPQDYLNAKRFLERLAFEVQSSNRPEGPLAANVSQTTQ